MCGNKPMRHAVAPLALLLLLAACVRPAPRIISGDDAPEAFVGGARLLQLYREEQGYLVSPILEAPGLASRVALWLSTTRDASELAVDLQVRGYGEQGAAGPWQDVEVRWHEGVQRVGRVELGHLLSAVELRLPSSQAERVAGLVWSAIVPEPHQAEPSASDVEIKAPGTSLHALAISGIEPRSAWNARANSGCSTNENKDWITVHHSVSALQGDGSLEDHAAAVRGIQAYHMDGRGYCDVGYHFATTADGTVWEAREARFLGAHTGSHNTNNAGLVFIGCFHPESDCNGLGATTPPDVMLQGGGAAIGRIAAHYGIAIGADTVIGHRDNADQSTACPGDSLHALLGQLRTIATGGGTPVASMGTVQGTVWDLSLTTDASQIEQTGAARPGATISVTGGETTSARAGDAYWSFELLPGTYTITATLAGYAASTREVQIAGGAEVWASIGISPLASAVDCTVRISDADSGATLDNATVTVTGAEPVQTNTLGEALFNLSAGEVTITASAEGYADKSVTQELVAGAPVVIDVALDAVAISDDPEGSAPLGPINAVGVERVTIRPTTQVKGGCGALPVMQQDTGALLAVTGALWLLARRRRSGANRPLSAATRGSL